MKAPQVIARHTERPRSTLVKRVDGGMQTSTRGYDAGLVRRPILIFGAGALARPDDSGLLWTGAISLVLLALAPFAAGAAIRAARE